MSRPQFTSLRLSLLALAVSATLPTFAFATETMTVTATGNARSSFEAPMMVSVIDTSLLKIKLLLQPLICCVMFLELLLMVPDEPTVRM